MLLDIHHLRDDYAKDTLDMADVDASPFVQFAAWFQDAQNSDVREPNAMTLSTIAANGRPKGRIVLLKQMDEAGGFVFYTNYGSSKGRDLAANPAAALTFFWDALQRQVRIEGVVSKISRAESEAYFKTRPKGSQIGATASPQSTVMPSRKVLEDSFRHIEEMYAGIEPLPCPDNWGGYRLVPDAIEFWQGRRSRLHDRIQYTLAPDGTWTRERLAP